MDICYFSNEVIRICDILVSLILLVNPIPDTKNTIAVAILDIRFPRRQRQASVNDQKLTFPGAQKQFLSQQYDNSPYHRRLVKFTYFWISRDYWDFNKIIDTTFIISTKCY